MIQGKLYGTCFADNSMKKITFIALLAATSALSAQVIEKVNYVGALHRDASKDWTKGWTEWNPKNASYASVTDTVTLNDASSIKKITSTVTLDAKTVYLLRSMLVVESGGKLVIPAGTVIRGAANLAATPKNYATIVVERGGMIDIQGTNTKPQLSRRRQNTKSFLSHPMAVQQARYCGGGCWMCHWFKASMTTRVHVAEHHTNRHHPDCQRTLCEASIT